uniref:Uncharacterized protein n=1 Tax=viral metagenome TaxID=1070528 RepID=A0A6C0BDF9_9ZZZZ
MLENSSGIIALVIIIVFVIIIIVALSWHPATAIIKPNGCDEAKSLLKTKQQQRNSPSALLTGRDQNISPLTDNSVVSDAWELVSKLRGRVQN